ncbi:37078_t:CDS:2, partial [Racocetra persica]
VMNFYGHLIIERAQNNPDIYPPVHVVNTFFYTKLMQNGFGVVAGWFTPRPNKKKKAPPPNFFDKDYIFIPINTGAHWTLAVANFKLRRFEYYDSMGSGFNLRFIQELREFFIYLAKQTNNQHFKFAEWGVYEPRKRTPQQNNSYDCGVFAMMTAEHISRNAPLSFSQSKMGYFRTKMIYEISTGSIMDENENVEVEDEDSFEEHLENMGQVTLKMAQTEEMKSLLSMSYISYCIYNCSSKNNIEIDEILCDFVVVEHIQVQAASVRQSERKLSK